ncbi:hypothetical protein G0Q06_04230 [Puniceicoccales bacterium CK1056]|uniref:Uncharacterized protein n=1 Tax=Oceanipulchritudo coccoides TaxID=2706888 RepID=A0A6B2LYD3_9BACT|nr:hypothetical protein [Oceanipulchritudo coccoides]NDV61651.1 hypothetical protein [Oceanipulchritudo coccoides]
MKINDAYTTLEGLLSHSDKKSKKIYQQLLGAVNNLKERELSSEERQVVEKLLERLRLDHAENMSVKELKNRSNLFQKEVMKALSLVSEDHYLTLGLGMGVAFGAVLGSYLIVFIGAPLGNASTGLGIGIGLVIGSIVARYLDIEARKQNRVLVTSTR